MPDIMAGNTTDVKIVTDTFKTADQLRCRVFDHKQFTSGEISFFLKEFEDKRTPIQGSIRDSKDILDSLEKTRKSIQESTAILETDVIEQVSHESKLLIDWLIGWLI